MLFENKGGENHLILCLEFAFSHLSALLVKHCGYASIMALMTPMETVFHKSFCQTAKASLLDNTSALITLCTVFGNEGIFTELN